MTSARVVAAWSVAFRSMSGSSRRARARVSGIIASAARSAGSSVSAAESMATASSSAVYVLVAAIARSGPAPSAIVRSAAADNADPGSLVMAIVGAPWARAAATTATISGEAPDWLMPITRASATSGAAP